MNKHGMLKATSVAIALCTVMSSTTFAFSTVASAATVDTTEKVSASTTKSKDNFSWDNASVYFLLTDRFRNGNTSNDHSYNRGLDQSGKVLSNIDDRATFHGGDFAGVTQSIEDGYFNNLGVNAIWISAPYEQTHGYVVGSDGNQVTLTIHTTATMFSTTHRQMQTSVLPRSLKLLLTQLMSTASELLWIS